MVQWLRVHTAVAEGWSLGPSTRVQWFAKTCNSSSRGSSALCWPPWLPALTYTYPHSQAHIHNKFLKSTKVIKSKRILRIYHSPKELGELLWFSMVWSPGWDLGPEPIVNQVSQWDPMRCGVWSAVAHQGWFYNCDTFTIANEATNQSGRNLGEQTEISVLSLYFFCRCKAILGLVRWLRR